MEATAARFALSWSLGTWALLMLFSPEGASHVLGIAGGFHSSSSSPGSAHRGLLLAIPALAASFVAIRWPKRIQRIVNVSAFGVSALFVVMTLSSIGLVFAPTAFALFIVASQQRTEYAPQA